MPSWLTPVLQWGGLALAVVSAAALIYVLGILVPAAEGEATEPIAAPVTLYWVRHHCRRPGERGSIFFGGADQN